MELASAEEPAAEALAAPEPPAGNADLLADGPDPLFDDDFDAEIGPQVYDPFEPGNRLILSFNQHVDTVLWSPVTTAYRFAMPDPARASLFRVFENLNAPIHIVNHLLQLKPLKAGESLLAFVLNSTFGLAGIIDAAGAAGITPEAADFGQTMAKVGVGMGPYMVVPIFGPITLRDGFGWIVDRAFHPATYFLGIPIQLIWRGGAGMVARDAAHDQLAALEESSVDFYSVLRSAYVQAREKEIYGSVDPSSAPDAPELELQGAATLAQNF